MSFGFSVGDFITVANLARTTWQQFVDAPEQFSAIYDEWISPAILAGKILIDFPESEVSRLSSTTLVFSSFERI
jgi:hypothetical protein